MKHGNSKKKLSSKISNQDLDDIYDVALRYGATGGKLLGAGGGGFMLFFVPPEKRQTLRDGLKDLIEVKLAFENDGSQIIYYNPNGI